VLATCTGRKVERLVGTDDISVCPVDRDAPGYIIRIGVAPDPGVRYDHFYDTTIARYTAQVAVFPVRAVKRVWY